MANLTDKEFEAKLREHLTGGDESRAVSTPMYLNEDTTIDREKTLALECYAGLTL